MESAGDFTFNDGSMKKKCVRVCASKACTTFGSHRVMEKITEETGLKPGDSNDTIDLDWCGCLGYCSQSPNIEIDETNIIFSTSSETVMQDIDDGGEDMSGDDITLENVYNVLENDTLFLEDEPMTDEQVRDKVQEAFPDVTVPENLPEDLSQGIRKGGRIRRIVVDRQGCIGAQSCVVVAPGVFQMDDENLAYVVDPDSEDEDTILMAAQSCPTLAILLFDEKGNQLFPEV